MGIEPASSGVANPPDEPVIAPAGWPRVRRRLMILGIVLVAVILGSAALLIANQHDADLADDTRLIERLSQALAEQTSRIIQPVDMTLREVQSRLEIVSLNGRETGLGPSSKAMFDLLVERAKNLPQVFALMVIGTDGQIQNVSTEYPPARVDVSGRDYFQYLSQHNEHALFVGIPVKNQHTGTPTVFLSRRINDSKGAFAGAVVASVTLTYFEDLYRAVIPEPGSATMLRRDGTILVRYPHIENQMGRKLPSEDPWYLAVVHGGGSFRTAGYFDSRPRLVTAMPLRDFPLVIDVATTEASVLARWKATAIKLLAGAALASIAAVLLLVQYGRQYSRLARHNARMSLQQQRFDAVLDNMSQGLTLFDPHGTLLVSNRRFAELYRLSPDQVRPGTPAREMTANRQAKQTFPDMTQQAYDARHDRLSASSKVFDVVDDLLDGRTIATHHKSLPGGGWVITHEEITERRRTDAALAFMARHDALTQLPNRTLFQERLAEAVALAGHGCHCGLLCLDLDRFKVVNDTLGHPIGDALLCAVAVRLNSLVRDGDTVARLGGDEFAIILKNLKLPEHAAALADRIIIAFYDPFDVEGHRIMAGISIGVSVAPRDGMLPEPLQQNADIALYLAKAEGRATYRFFEPEIDSHIQRRRSVEFDLRNALPEADFLLHYQPVLDLASGQVTGFEALIRWLHPVRGMVSPADFIPIAEETGLIVPMSAWVLQTACMQAADWPEDIEIAVNLSPVQFKRGNLLEIVQGALDASGLSPHRLELEITESTLLENSADRLALLHELRALGIRIALDDFGTGYSSLSYLRSFPFDKIKIDRSFIADVNTNKDSTAIVGAIVGLARSLRMTTVAEGLETVQQLAMVREQGIAKGQGYLFSRPCPAAEAGALIRTLRVPEPGLSPAATRETVLTV